MADNDPEKGAGRAGLFVGSGSVLALGGPCFILVAYIIMSLLVYGGVVTALTEIATYLPVHGGTMSYYGYRYVSRSMGFALGYLYWYALGILVPYEITAAGLVIDYWQNDVNIAVWISVMIVVIVALNFLPVKFYGETEFWFAGTKVILMIGLLLLSFILFWGGGPTHDRLGFRYWKAPEGPVHTYIKTGDAGRTIAFFSVLVSSVFPFTFAPELLVVTGGEMESPRRNLPIAAKRYFYRLIVFYVFGVLAIGVTCPSTDSRLTSGGAGAGSSAFVIAIVNAHISALPSIVNAVILISAWSSGVERPYRSRLQPYGAYVAGVLFTLLCLINGYTVFFPGLFSAKSFLTAYIGIPIFLGMYFGHRIVFWRDKWAWAPEEVDLKTGLEEVQEADTPVKTRKGWAKAAYIFE
ncbi:hypothetical protein DV737_g5626, partial [Chaetothyriales sp. CBS 132003]